MSHSPKWRKCGTIDRVLCQRLNQAEIEYYGDIPANTVVYLDQPQIVYRMTKRGKRSKQPEIIAQQRYEVRQLLDHPGLEWATLTLRPYERGMLSARFGRYRVWTVHKDTVVKSGF